MKILHIWNTAGVPSNIAKNMDYLTKTKSVVLSREKYMKYHDTYGDSISGGLPKFYFHVVKHIFRDYDIIHIHDFDERIPAIKPFMKKPIILHYHGSRIRGQWGARKRFWEKADRLIVSTPDLLEDAPDHALHITDPVDIQRIEKIKYSPEPETALYTNVRKGSAVDLAVEIARKNGLCLDVHSRDDYPLKHDEYLSFMSKFEYFIDIRRQYKDKTQVYNALSLGALEALEMGLKVIDYRGEILTKVPFALESRNNTMKFYRLYLELLK